MNAELSRLKARIGAQERLTALLYARVEELSQDMTASFKQLAEYQVAFEQRIDARFDRIEATMATKEDIAAMATKEDIAAMATKEDIAALTTRIDSIEERMATKEDVAAMATKEDVAAMEERILDAFQQLVLVVDKRLSQANR